MAQFVHSDAFSKALGQSHTSRLKKQQPNSIVNDSNTSVSELSRVFQSTSIESLTTPIPKPQQYHIQKAADSDIDESPMSFKDIQAKFQHNTISYTQTEYRKPIPLQPSKTGPPSLQQKPVFVNKTGPPSLPVKPQILRHSSLPSTAAIPTSIPNVKEELSIVSPETTGSSTESSKRLKVMQELIDTEKIYQNDMNVLYEVYYKRASQGGFSKSDIRQLFSNLGEIIEFESTFITLLTSSYDQDTIGASFLETMHIIDSVYSEYCKRHEDAVLKLQELENQPETQQFLLNCKDQLQGKTASWDLGSLLIKPVQRVLKYPLLLRELLSLTPITHKDHENLMKAVLEIGKVANNINEIKKRKDIVERIVGDKKKTEINYVHGINKKFSRRAQKIKQAAGLAVEPTHDVLFEALYIKFEEQQEIIKQLARDVQGWVRHVKIMFETLQQLACSMEALYGAWGGVRVTSLTDIGNFSKMATHLSTHLSRELDNNVRGYVYSRIDDFLKVFENPLHVIHKRAKKMVDYDRVRDIKSKGEVPDKALQESADAYVSINAQLLDELPKFFDLTDKYFDILIGGIALVQKKFNKSMQKEWLQLVEQQMGMQAGESYDAIVAIYISRLDDLDQLTSQIRILRKVETRNRSKSSVLLRQKSTEHRMPRRMTDSAIHIQLDTTEKEEEQPELVDTSKDFNCIVLYDFETNEPDRLDVKRGTILRISQDENYIDQDWWFGTTEDDGKSGWVPINYCKKLA